MQENKSWQTRREFEKQLANMRQFLRSGCKRVNKENEEHKEITVQMTYTNRVKTIDCILQDWQISPRTRRPRESEALCFDTQRDAKVATLHNSQDCYLETIETNEDTLDRS